MKEFATDTNVVNHFREVAMKRSPLSGMSTSVTILVVGYIILYCASFKALKPVPASPARLHLHSKDVEVL